MSVSSVLATASTMLLRRSNQGRQEKAALLLKEPKEVATDLLPSVEFTQMGRPAVERRRIVVRDVYSNSSTASGIAAREILGVGGQESGRLLMWEKALSIDAIISCIIPCRFSCGRDDRAMESKLEKLNGTGRNNGGTYPHFEPRVLASDSKQRKKRLAQSLIELSFLHDGLHSGAASTMEFGIVA
jgi:hypothetical protein